MEHRLAIFTIVSANYIAYAATLMQSVRTFHPDAARFIILSDARHEFDGLDLAAEVIACDELGIQLIGNMKLWYTVIEFNTAVKPFSFAHLFTARGIGAAIYLDPDIELYAPLSEVQQALEDHSLVLTPHMEKPLQDGKHPSDLAIMKSGVYNLGFAAIRNDEDGRDLIRWWSDRLYTHCRVDIAGNLFTDQRWMDLAPAFVARTFILRHPGYNAAYWNVVHRRIERDAAGEWRSNGQKLVFYHFSGIKPEDPTVFSKHQNRFTVETLGPIRELCDEYRARVLANGWLRFNTIAYAYATFGDGWPILDTMRHCIMREVDECRLRTDQPLRIGSSYFDQPEDRVFANGARLTRFAYQFWLDRPDLQAAFGLQTAHGVENYLAWFCGGSAEREGVTARLVQAARTLRDGAAAPPRSGLPQFAPPPWPAVSEEAWDGPADRAQEWLTGEVELSIGGAHTWLERQAALLWERRIDLQHFFPNRSLNEIEQYQAWCLTQGVRDGVILPSLFSARYMGWLNRPSPISRLYTEVPITNGMAVTRHVEAGRDGLPTWREFPLDPQARIEQAFWYTYLAPNLFGWPREIVASVREWMEGPSGIKLDEFNLTRGMVAPHTMRADVRGYFDLATPNGQWNYIRWLLTTGADEYGYDPIELCPGLRLFLHGPSPRHRGLSLLAEFVYYWREDLQRAFDLSVPADLAGLQRWTRGEMAPWLKSVGFGSLVTDTDEVAASPPHRAYLALSGDWTISSGVGEDLRTAVAALEAVGYTDFAIIDLRSAKMFGADRRELESGRGLEAAWHVVVHNADTATDDWLTFRKMGVTAKRTVGRWFWELERIPARWRHAFSFYDEVWAASRFVQEVFEAEDLRPVRLLNSCVVAPTQGEQISRGQLGLQEDTTVFLFMFDFASYATRKNPHGVVRAFLEAFPLKTERVQLVIKSQNASMRPDLWSELVALSLDPRITIRDARLSRDELISLIATADAFVSLHRSEGFGLGPAEAMSLGVPVILTGYSGTNDFADETCACVVPYTLVPVKPDEYPGVEGQRWAEPDVQTAAHYMRWVHEHPSDARAMALKGRERVETLLNPVRIGRDLLRLTGANASSEADWADAQEPGSAAL